MTHLHTPGVPARGWHLGLWSITLLGLGLRLVGLDAQSYWYDEAVTQDLIRHPAYDLLVGTVKDNGNPNLYMVLARVWQSAVGEGDTRLRLLSVLCGALTVPALGRFARRVAGPAAGLAAAGLYAISPLAVEFANEARTYALLQLLAVINAWFFVRWLADRRPVDWLGYAASMALCWYSHYYAAFLTVAHLLTLAALPGGTRPWAGWAAALAAAGLADAFWLPAFAAQLTSPGNLTRSAENWKVQFLATPVTHSLGRTFAWRESPPWLLLVAGVGTVVAFVVPAVLGVARLGWKRPATVLLVGWVLVPVLLPLLLAVAGRPVYSHRYAAIGLPAFAVCVASGYVALRPAPRWALAAVAVGMTAVSLYRYAGEPLKDDWRSATPVVLARLDPGGLLVFDTAIEVVSFRHYAGPDKPDGAIALNTTPDDGPALPGVKYRAGERIDPAARDCAGDIFAADRVCLVLCVPNRSAGEYADLFRAHGYSPTSTDDFHRIRVLVFTRPPQDRVGGPTRGASPRPAGAP